LKIWFEVNNLPIRYKLIIHFLLISILPSILLGMLIWWAVDNIIEEQVNDNTLQLIDKVNGSIESYIDNVKNMTYFISFDPNIQRFLTGDLDIDMMAADDEYRMTRFMRNFTTLYSEVAGILVVNHQGEYVSNELYSRTARSLTEETWYREAVEQKGIAKVIGQPWGRNLASHANYQDGEVVSVVRAIIDPETQQERGVVLIDLKLRTIEEAVRDVRLGKTGYLMVIDEMGEIIYSPMQSILNEIPVEALLEGKRGNYSQSINGEHMQFIYQKSPYTNWTTVGVFSAESVSEVQQIRLYIVSFVFFVCLVGITASYYLSNTMSRPISQLMSAMQKAEEGDLSSRYKGSREDEVGRLGRSFNKMIAQIHKLILLNERQERQKREAELHSLQAHIKPHFLYNTLETIQWMARKRGAPDVADVVASLAKLFRIGLSKGNTIIPLMQEVEHIESYLTIQSTRYREKLNYQIKISPEIEDVSVLKIVLQPIVENAIYHGIKERRGPGMIEIEAWEKDNQLIVQIRDDGKGMSAEKLQELRDSLSTFLTRDDEKAGAEGAIKGYGIVNVDARLKLTFGKEYGLTIDSKIDKGTTVTIHHPILKGNTQSEKWR
jgi:two-component system sensor histidine kinase YesM